MRNLKNVQHTHIKFSDPSLPLTASAWDVDSDGLICTFGPSDSETVIELRRFSKYACCPEDGTLIASWDAPCPNPNLACDKILSLKYLAENHTTCIILAGGDLVLARETPQDGEELIEIVGSVDAGIEAAVWSPDDELVAIVTGADTLIIMTRLFEPTANAVISVDDVKISAHVSVGWGKRETQFQGKRAKALRDPTVPEHVDEGTPSPYDDGGINISWRGDGAYLAISRLDSINETRRRMIRIYSREGVLDSVSEPVDGLEGCLSWRPAGNLIASVQHRSDRVDVVFFERNGLRHGQFTLRLDSAARLDWAKDIKLSWNNDSTVLAVGFADRVQLWTMGNYHYYLKQEISFPHQPAAVQVAWHPERPIHLGVYGAKDLLNLAFHLLPTTDAPLPPHDYGLCAAIDGANLKITPLRLANIPPPMAFADVSLSSNALDVCYNSDSSMIAVLRADFVDLIRLDLDTAEPCVQGITESISLFNHGTPDLKPYQIAMGQNDAVVILSNKPNTRESVLSIVQQDHTIRILSTIDMGQVYALHTAMTSKSLFVQRTGSNRVGSSLATVDVESAAVREVAKLPSICPHLQIWEDEQVMLLIGLTAGGSLYVHGGLGPGTTFDQRLHVKGVTSFLVSQAHLMFTTASHLVKFVHLHDGALEVPLDEPEKDERCRSVERGARLVTVMPSTYSLVLQMPRGNLETIYPRALVLAGIRRAISAKNYRKAFFACRNHRVDMNIIHDYAPSQFLSCIPLFVDQIKKPAHIDLFLSQLRDEDVTETLYKDTLSMGREGGENTALTDTSRGILADGLKKVNRICVAFLSALATRQKTHLQNIVTSHVCQVPPDHESALALISDLRRSAPAEADKAVEHICFLADSYRLYDTALGLYDLEVALLIAQQSQKDPREYLPYLQSLQESSDLRRKFTIDNDLKRHSKALKWLHDLDVFDEFKRYMARHELYAEAVELVRYDKGRLAEIMRVQADWLALGNRFSEAAIAYEYLQDYASASDAYKSATLWREALSCAQLAGHSVEDVRALARDLADGLVESKDWADAAKVYADYLDDAEEAATCYCKAYLFSDAISVVANKGRINLLATAIDTGIADAFATLSEMLAEMKTQMTSQRSRLRELRIKKANDPLSFFDDAPGGGHSHTNNNNNPDIPDDVSLAASSTATTSAGTFMTRYTHRTTSTLATNTTNRSGKNRRREERKRARGKKGSVYEEEYLVASTGRLVERLNAVVGSDVRRLVEGCMRRAMRERAVALQRLAAEVVALAEEVVPEAYGLMGADAAERVQQQQQQHGEEAEELQSHPAVVVPVVRKFEALGLIT